MNERVGAAAVINRHFQNGETTCRQLSKRLPDNSTIFAAEATAISLALRVVTGLEKCLNFSGVLKKCLIFNFALKKVIFPGKVLENDSFILEK